VAEGQFNDQGWAYITELEEGRYRLVFLGQIEENYWD
jgi:hypothetical protein